MNKKVSVIIPAYNIEKYLFKCVDSVLTQTYQNFEIIIVNDGSSDNTFECMKALAAMDSRIRIFDSENQGQGYQRNHMLEKAQGDYILFLDSDDYIEPYTLELAVKRIVEDQSDLVYFDWKYYSDKTERFNYKNKELFFGKKTLEGDDCLMLLSLNPYFSVNRLYSKSFLVNNNIKYGEGHLYEDNPFIVATAFYAKKISIIHSPLYVVRVSGTSSTKTKTNTDVHYVGFIKSVRSCKEILQQKPNKKHYYYYKYALSRYFLYVRTRIPNELREQFSHEFLDLLSDVDIEPLRKKDKADRAMRLFIRHKVFKKKKILYLDLLTFYFEKLKPRLKKIKAFIKNKKNGTISFFKNIVKKLKNKPIPANHSKKYKKYLTYELKENTVLFLGFDFRYTGNSRYLFEQMLEDPGNKTIYFATNDKAVDEKYRLTPHSNKFFEILATANVLIFESWTPPAFRKRLNATWIQLWHGTPLKKMLFDSEETEIITKRDSHKIDKYIDIQKWDYLVVDNPNINKYFETSFLFPKQKFIPCGYPRVKYLADNISNDNLKKEIKEKYNLPSDKKLVVYLPTWRDYNYGKTDNIDNAYLLDVALLGQKLGEGYFVVDKNHSYLNTAPTANQNMETQELLLVADYLVTDYSSVMFDAFAIDIPVVIYCNDFEKYQKSRGVYPEMWNDLKPYVSEDLDSLCDMIKNYRFGPEYQYIKDYYCFKDNVAWLFNNIDRALNSQNSKKRAMFLLNNESGLTSDTLCTMRHASEFGNEFFVLIDSKTADSNELYPYKVELEELKYVNCVLIKGDSSIEDILRLNHISTLVLEDTPANRNDFESQYEGFEKIFVK